MPSSRTLVALIAVVLCVIGGCHDSHGPTTDSESHFLSLCDGSCPEGLECICSTCTKICDDDVVCDAIQSEASCVVGIELPTALQCTQNVRQDVCDMACATDGDCTSVNSVLECQSGYCRSSELSEVADADVSGPHIGGSADRADANAYSPDGRELDGGDRPESAGLDGGTVGSGENAATDGGGFSDDGSAAIADAGPPPSLTALNGNRYSFRVNREWKGSTDYRGLPWNEGWEELPEEDFESVAAGPNYSVTFTEDGSQVQIHDAENPEWTMSYPATESSADERTRVYEFDSNLRPPLPLLAGGRLRVWIGGSGFEAELMGYGSGLPIVACERGRLVDSCETDADCTFGFVCEPGTGCLIDLNACVQGCHEDTDCSVGSTCSTETQCLTCPCPGTCVANDSP